MNMQRQQGDIVRELLSQNYHNYAAEASAKILALSGGMEQLYAIATDTSVPLSNKKAQQLTFRAAYTLEYICFNHAEIFAPYLERFMEDFPHCVNHSARRSFAKSMAHILKSHTPTQRHAEAIAQSAALWISEPNTKVAVMVWSINVLALLRPRIEWLDDDAWSDIEAVIMKSPSPALECRKRRGWK